MRNEFTTTVTIDDCMKELLERKPDKVIEAATYYDLQYYRGSSICERLYEVSNDMIDDYFDDLLGFAGTYENVEYMERALSEFSDLSYWNLIKMAECMRNEDEVIEHRETIVTCWILQELKRNGVKEITYEQLNDIEFKAEEDNVNIILDYVTEFINTAA